MDVCFSYSAPTSMGKSFIMRMFVKDEIMHGAQKNYALIVPTKALINEVRVKVIDDLGGEKNTERVNYLKLHNYSVVIAASDIALEDEKRNFFLVMTPERFLYLLIAKPCFDLDYLFIDEALNWNNWYDYVEFGTTNPLTILLQRSGFSRESARYIKEHHENVIRDGSTGQLKLSPALARCGNADVRNEVIYIRQNSPEIFESDNND